MLSAPPGEADAELDAGVLAAASAAPGLLSVSWVPFFTSGLGRHNSPFHFIGVKSLYSAKT